MRLVFNFTAISLDQSLNKHLLQGPDRMNGLICVYSRDFENTHSSNIYVTSNKCHHLWHGGAVTVIYRTVYLTQPAVKPERFYILPGAQKPGNPGRPIVSSNSHSTERISYPTSFTTTVILQFINCSSLLVTLTTFLTNSLPSIINPLIPY